MKGFLKLLLASLKQFYRDKTALFFTFAFPLLFMIIFGLVFSGVQNVSYDIGLVNNDPSPAAAQISQAIGQVPIFKVSQGSQDEEMTRLSNGDVRAVIIVPADFETTVTSGKTADITVYYDPSQTASSQVILSVLRQVVDQVNRQLTNQPLLVQLNDQPVQTHNLSDIDFLVPGIVAMSLLFLGLFGGLPMVEWREKKILKRFGATPISRSVVLSSQVVYRLMLSLVQTLIIIVVARVVFNVQMIGNWLLLFGLVLLGALTFVSIGYFAVARARTTESAMPIVQLVQFPMLFLSGIFFPVEFLPDFMRPIVNAMPLTYLGDALRQVMVDATPLFPLFLDVAVLAGWLVACVLLGVWLFRWE